MAYIYKITNLINQKSYIGKTYKVNPIERFYEHQKDSHRFPERPLYRAFSKYGFDKFTFDILEETNEPEEREIYWIDFYNTYSSKGYNATLGGDGKKLFDTNQIIKDYLILQDQMAVAKKHGCEATLVGNILREYNIERVPSEIVIAKKYGKKVEMLSKDTREVIRVFDSQIEAGRFLIENGYSAINNAKNLSSKISLVCRGKRQTCSGFAWRYID